MRRTILTAVLLLALAGPASAQDATISAKLSPSKPKAGATLHVALSGTAPALDGALPQSIVLDLQRGFAVDTAAVAARCVAPATTTGACPAASRIGHGAALAHASGLLNQDIPATIDLFLAAPVQPGDLAGVVLRVTALGASKTIGARLLARSSGPFGYELRADGFAAAIPSFPHVTIGLDSLTLDVGTHRDATTTVVTHKRITRGGKRVTVKRKVRRKVRHDLLRNPKTCSGHWTVRATVSAAAGGSSDLALPCSKR